MTLNRTQALNVAKSALVYMVLLETNAPDVAMGTVVKQSVSGA